MAGESVIGDSIKGIVPGGNIIVAFVFVGAILLLAALGGAYYWYRLYKHRLSILAEYGTGISKESKKCKIVYSKTGEPKELKIFGSKRTIPYPMEGLCAIPEKNHLVFHYYKDSNGNYKPLYYNSETMTWEVQNTSDKAWFEHKVMENQTKYATNPMMMMVISIAVIAIVAIGSGIMLYYFSSSLVGAVQNHDTILGQMTKDLTNATIIQANLTSQVLQACTGHVATIVNGGGPLG
jgi:hypothetical protein